MGHSGVDEGHTFTHVCSWLAWSCNEMEPTRNACGRPEHHLPVAEATREHVAHAVLFGELSVSSNLPHRASHVNSGPSC
jgi:hypothetical protein